MNQTQDLHVKIQDYLSAIMMMITKGL